MKNYLLTQLGWLAVGTGIVGIFVPLMPTTCFLIAAMWCFASGSPETAERVKQHRLVGPIIRRIGTKFLPSI